MATLTALGARRIRTLANLGEIELSPITVLLGKNSVGKSTYARLFPLLRQSAERKKRAPILWYDDLVDFGGFSETVTRGESDLEFLFTINDLTNKKQRPRQLLFWEPGTPIDISISKISISLKLALSDTDSTYASEISIKLNDQIYCVKINSDNEIESISINGIYKQWDKSKIRVVTEQGSILPRIFFAHKKKQDDDLWSLTRNPWRNSLIDTLHRYVHGNTSRGTIAKIASQIPLADKDVVSEKLKSIDGPFSWQSIRPFISYEDIIDSQVIANIDAIFELIDDSLSHIVKGIRYLKPLRATAERHYRRVDLAISEIDPEGRNLPIFLDSLSHYQLSDFRTWLKENINIDVEPQRKGAQIMLMAKGPNDAVPSNVADMGFGISQVLPIAAQLWASTTQLLGRLDKASFIVIEQPELHLHPAFQANLANLFAGVVKPNNGNGFSRNLERPKIIIETHSQHIIYRLGALIESGILSPEDVSVVLFEPSETHLGTSAARISKFDEEGILQNWPFGFFEPEN